MRQISRHPGKTERWIREKVRPNVAAEQWRMIILRTHRIAARCVPTGICLRAPEWADSPSGVGEEVQSVLRRGDGCNRADDDKFRPSHNIGITAGKTREHNHA